MKREMARITTKHPHGQSYNQTVHTSSAANCHPYKGTSSVHALSGYQYVAHYS